MYLILCFIFIIIGTSLIIFTKKLAENDFVFSVFSKIGGWFFIAVGLAMLASILFGETTLPLSSN